jgi:acetylornithine deacetylase/succinyl-diaminopimelate desuccinylase-like protein
MTVDAKLVMDKIDTDELVKVTLDLANIDSPTGSEGPVADYVHDWLTKNGIDSRKIGLYPDRPNVVATIPGSGNGRSLAFNSHMDTTIHKDEIWTTRHAADKLFHTGWREDDTLVGNGVCNCKGPMATWMLAAKAIRDSGVKLAGDLVLTAVVGEIGLEPVDEFQPPNYLAKEAGTRYAITHGAVTDYALVSEGTNFGIVGVEAGKAFFKITVFGNDLTIYTPYIERPTTVEKSACRSWSRASTNGPTSTSKGTAMNAPVASWCRRSISARSAAVCRTKSPSRCSNARSMSTCASRRSRSRLTSAKSFAA